MLQFFTDPHLGVNRIAGTTQESRTRLSKLIYFSVMRILVSNDYDTFCLGDLFDSYSNPENVILLGDAVFRNVTKVMAGNHDISNRLNAFGSFELLRTLHHDKAWYTPFGESGVYWHYTPDAALAAIPHVSSQELFIESLELAEKDATAHSNVFKVLLLHCNFDLRHEVSDTTLNLSMEWASRLSHSFDIILLGHEHAPRKITGLQDKVFVLGNIHPTGFADISDKFTYQLNPRTGTMTKTKVWSMQDLYLECDWKSLQDSLEAAEGRQFVRLMGSMTQQEVPILARLVNKIWQQGDSLAVRVDVQLDAAYSTGPVQRGDSNTLAARITSALQSGNDQEVYRLWNKLSEAS
jgi:DNA repair exonuclease SbcCD nuclease subunit